MRVYWIAAVFGLFACAAGTLMIVFREAVARAFLLLPRGHPRTPQSAAFTGVVFVLFGLLFLWGSVKSA